MSALLLCVFSGLLLGLMMGLRWTSRTLPNAELLLEAMRDNLVDGSGSGGRSL